MELSHLDLVKHISDWRRSSPPAFFIVGNYKDTHTTVALRPRPDVNIILWGAVLFRGPYSPTNRLLRLGEHVRTQGKLSRGFESWISTGSTVRSISAEVMSPGEGRSVPEVSQANGMINKPFRQESGCQALPHNRNSLRVQGSRSEQRV